MRFVQALHWLRDTTHADDADMLRRQLRSLLARLPDGEAIRADLVEGMATLPAWMQDLLRPVVATDEQAA